MTDRMTVGRVEFGPANRALPETTLRIPMPAGVKPPPPAPGSQPVSRLTPPSRTP